MSTNELSTSAVDSQVAAASQVEGEGFDPTVLRVTLALYRTSTVFERAGSAELAQIDLTTPQFNVLTVLRRAPHPLTMGELAAAVTALPANLTSVVDRLVERGLIAREANPSDRRSYLVSLTQSGSRLLAEFLPDHWRYLNSLMDDLTADQRIHLANLLEELRISIESTVDRVPAK